MANEMTNYAALKLAANTIKNEVEDGANTAERVGTAILNLVEAANDDIQAHNEELKNVDALRNTSEELTKEILGKWLLLDAALYDEQVEKSYTEGTKLRFTAVETSTGYPSYGVELPSSLTDGETYTIKGTIKNNATNALSVGNYSSLYPEDETPDFWLCYDLAAGSSVAINATFTYDADKPYLAFVKSVLSTADDYVEFDLYIVHDDAAVPVLEEKVDALETGATETAEDIAEIQDFQEDIYTDVYGQKRLLETALYDEQVTAEVSGGSVILTAVDTSTGYPSYGVKLPTTLTDGERYTIKGTITNNASTAVSIGNYSSLYPSSEEQNFWLVYDLAVDETATIDYTFTYDASKPYLVLNKSALNTAGDEVVLTLYVCDGEDLVNRVAALEGDGESSVIENLYPAVLATDGTLLALLNEGTNTGWTMTQETGGVRMIASGATTNYTIEEIPLYPEQSGAFDIDTKYGVFLDIESESITLLDEQDILEVTMSFVKSDYTQNSATFRIKQGEILDDGYTRSLQQVAFFETGESDSDFSYVRMKIMKYNTTGATDEITNILIKRLIFFEVTTPYADYSELDFVALLKNAGAFSSLAVVAAARMPHANLLYDGLKLKSLGDSLPETTAFQPYIAQAMGMTYDADEEITDDGDYKRSAMGSTRVVPTIWASSGAGATGNSVYMRARSLSHFAPDVLIILAGYNDIQAGNAYITGGTATEPSDYGIDDEPYTGEEIDLVSDPTASVPSFGASYRGMIEQILTDMPYLRIILCGIPRGSGEAGLYGADDDWVAAKNAVIERIAYEYGLPFVDLAKVYGVNALNYKWLTKDGLHFSDFGGKRVAQEIIAKAF